MPEIAFVIPVRNDAARLRRCLQSIVENDYPRSRVEVVVVDNGSADASASVARSAGARVIDGPPGSLGELRNLGAAETGAAIVAFVDADHVLAAQWIRAAIDGLSADSSIGAVGAMCHAPANGTWVQRAYDLLRGHQTGQGVVDWLGSGNMAVSRRAFERVGGFDPHLTTCEDVDLCKRLRAAGFRVVADERLVNVHHGDPATLLALFRSELWRGRGNIAVSFRRPVTLREMPSAIAPVAQLAGLLLAASALAMTGIPRLLAATLGLAPFVLVPILRATRMSRRMISLTFRSVLSNVLVALVYDLARAAALVAFARHGVRRDSRRPANA